MNDQRLKRQLGVGGAVMLGLGSILGTGVFVSIGLAAEVAGAYVLPAVALAALLAACNGLSSAQLAAAHPVSGGTYEYGYKYLHPQLGFTAGWLFMTAKSASAATAALGFAGYLLGLIDPTFSRTLLVAVAVGVIVLLTALVLSGLRRSNKINIVIVSITVATLAIFIVAAGRALGPIDGEPPNPANPAVSGATGSSEHTWFDLLHGSALMFVAYTGYGRIATLGEEIRQPRKKIPAAIIITLIASALLYIGVAWTITRTQQTADAGGRMLDLTPAPLESIARFIGAESAAAAGQGTASGANGLIWLVTLGALTAMLGVLLNLILGLSRVLLAMGRRADVPAFLGRLNAAGETPGPAVVMVGILIAGLALIGDVRLTWSFSAFTVLCYYALTNAAALRLPADARLYPRPIAWAGLFGCFGLAFFVPVAIWGVGLAWIGAGLIWHRLAVARRTPTA